MKQIERKKRLGASWDYYATDWDKYKLDSEVKESNYKFAELILSLYALLCLTSSFLAVITNKPN